jgi:hypothetical protein
MAKENPEGDTLAAGIAKLMTLLAAHGFSHISGDSGVASGGRFATANFRRKNLEIGLIVRSKSSLGCPNYTEGHGYAGHSDLIAELDPSFEPRLVTDSGMDYHARDGGDAFDALFEDLQNIILPTLENTPEEFSRALANAHKRMFDRMN